MAENSILRCKNVMLLVSLSLTVVLLYFYGRIGNISTYFPGIVATGQQKSDVTKLDNGDSEHSLNRTQRPTYCNGEPLNLSDAELEALLWKIYWNLTTPAMAWDHPTHDNIRSNTTIAKAISQAVEFSKRPTLRLAGLNAMHCASRLRPKQAPATKNIVLWTEHNYKHFEDWTNRMNCLTGPFICRYTFDKSKVESSDAVLFHLRAVERDVGSFLKNAPKTKPWNQSWVIEVLESPIKSMSARNQLLAFDPIFNYSTTYSEKSDVTIQYGECIHVSTLAADWPRTSASVEMLPIIMQHWTSRINFDFVATKSNMVAWFVSKCVTSSNREQFVNKLGKHIPVDVFGGCGKMGRPKCQSKSHCSTTLNKYKFYLAFENSLCRDYASEKIFKTLLSDTFVVPIVLGVGPYEKLLPPHSYIDILDFADAEELAKYLHYLARNDEAYNAYFEWRKQYACRLVVPSCVLCDALHQMRIKPRTDMVAIFGRAENCIEPQQYYSSAKSKFKDTY